MSNTVVVVESPDGEAIGIGWNREAAVADSKARGHTGAGRFRDPTPEEERDFRALHQRFVSPERLEAQALDVEQVTLREDQAQDTATYRRAKAFAERLNVPLVLVSDGPGTPIPDRGIVELSTLDAEDATTYRMARRYAEMSNCELDIRNDVPRLDSDDPPSWYKKTPPIYLTQAEASDTSTYRRSRDEAERLGVPLIIEGEA